MKNRFPFVIALGLGSLTVSAAEFKGVKMPDQVEVAHKNLKLNGLGARQATVFKVNVYIAGLYLETPTHDAKTVIDSAQLKSVRMTFTREVDSRKIKDVWAESFQKNCGSQCTALQSQLSAFLGMMEDFKKDDTMGFNFYADHTEIAVKGHDKGKIDGAEFGKVLLTVWFGPNPPNDALKSGMLGAR